MPNRRPRLSQATDILTRFPRTNPPPPRYMAYIRARHRFWETFPDGKYVRMLTPGTDFECGLYAVRFSMAYQCNGLAAERDKEGKGETENGKAKGRSKVRVPSMAELRAVVKDVTREMGMAMGEEGMGEVGGLIGEGGWFTADQLAAVFAEWGKREGIKCQLGYVSEDADGLPVMMSTAEVDTDDVGEEIVRVWVWNDGGSMSGQIGHFEGLRRPTEQDMTEGHGRDGGEDEVVEIRLDDTMPKEEERRNEGEEEAVDKQLDDTSPTENGRMGSMLLRLRKEREERRNVTEAKRE